MSYYGFRRIQSAGAEDVTPPQVVSATISGDGTTMTVVFTEPVDITDTTGLSFDQDLQAVVDFDLATDTINEDEAILVLSCNVLNTHPDEDTVFDITYISGPATSKDFTTSFPIRVTSIAITNPPPDFTGDVIAIGFASLTPDDGIAEDDREYVFGIEPVSNWLRVGTTNPTTTITVADVGGSSPGIPPPSVTYTDDFSTVRTSGYYNLQGQTDPTWTTDGPSGSDTLYSTIPSGTTGINRRSELSWTGGNTNFSQSDLEYNQNYSFAQQLKCLDPGDDVRCAIWQTHAATGADSGSSPSVSFVANWNNESPNGIGGNDVFSMKIDGIDSTDFAVLPACPKPSDIAGKWIKLWCDFRYNHGNRTVGTDTGTPVTGWRDGMIRFYMTVGTATTLPADPTASNLVAVYDDYLGVVSTTLPSQPFYFKTGLYNFGNPTTPADIEMYINEVYVQDEFLLTVDSENTYQKWHPVVLEFDHSSSLPTSANSTWTNYRLDVTFTSPTANTFVVPGFFSGSGTALSGGSEAGTVWRCIFTPDEIGVWSYSVSFKTGTNVAINGGGSSASFDGTTGNFTVIASTKTGDDLRAKGRVTYDGTRYMTYAETGDISLRFGPDSPENLLNYADFSDTPNNTTSANSGKLRNWNQHASDYTGNYDYTWDSGKGQNLIGALEYLASQGMNVISFLTFTIDGDDDCVFPHRGTVANPSSFAQLHQSRFAVRKLEEWDQIFKACDALGISLHFKLQETENETFINGGALGNERKLYYREMIARFSYHLGVTWNMGEEYEQSTADLKDFVQFFYDNDPYRHLTVVHTRTYGQNSIYGDMTGAQSVMSGASVQSDRKEDINAEIANWIDQDNEWVVMSSEFGPANGGVHTDTTYSGTYVRTPKTINRATGYGWNESGGMVIMPISDMGTAGGNWDAIATGQTQPNSGYTPPTNGTDEEIYYVWKEDISNYDNITAASTADTERITFYMNLSAAGEYRIALYTWQPNRVPGNGDPVHTANNDLWLRLPDTGGRGGASASFGTGAWEKVFTSVANSWVWQTRIEVSGTNYNNIYMDVPSAGTYRLELAGRSALFCVARAVVYRTDGGSSVENAALDESTAASSTDFTTSGHNHELRWKALWGSLLAGGDGVEYYFGSDTGAGDLYCEDWRTREEKWEESKIAKDFFADHMNDAVIYDMVESNSLLSSQYCYCFADPGTRYVIYKPAGDIDCTIDLTGTSYTVKWYDPRNGGSLQDGSVTNVSSGSNVALGNPPNNASLDWVILIE